jgi:hypothetical protein
MEWWGSVGFFETDYEKQAAFTFHYRFFTRAEITQGIDSAAVLGYKNPGWRVSRPGC